MSKIRQVNVDSSRDENTLIDDNLRELTVIFFSILGVYDLRMVIDDYIR